MIVNMKNCTWHVDDFEKNMKKDVKIKKALRKAKLMGKVFCGSAVNQLFAADTLSWGAVIGLVQGFKYNGNLKRGLTAGAITCGVISIVSGIANVKANMKAINEHLKKD